MNLFGKKFEYKIYIDGMSCSHCSGRVENAFNNIKGIFAKVNLEEKVAYITSKKEITEEFAKNIVEELGFNFVRFE